MGCNCGKRAAEANRDYSTVRWLVDGQEYPTLAEARAAATASGSQVQRTFGK
jgi:hypothetical protein